MTKNMLLHQDMHHKTQIITEVLFMAKKFGLLVQLPIHFQLNSEQMIIVVELLMKEHVENAY
jgi:hypothetical protein